MDRAAPTAGQFDLLTAVTYEIGHLLGYGHSSDTLDVMADTLPVGTRRLPGISPLPSHDQLETVVASPLLLPETRLNMRQSDLVDHTLLAGAVKDDTVAKIDLWLLPLAPADYVDLPRVSSDALEVRLLNDIAEEETELLEEELLGLLARPAG